MKKPLVCSTLALTVLLAGHVRAQDVFGMALNQPLRMSECATRQGDYLPDDDALCYQWPKDVARASRPPADGAVIVHVPRSSRPGFMAGDRVMVGLKDGHTVSIAARTHGSNGDLGDLRALQDMFGKASPQYSSAGTGQSTTATWVLSDGNTAYYNSAEYGIYSGLLRVQTPAAHPHQPGYWD